jgi:hypothetical protein
VEGSVARRMLLTEGSRAPRGCIVLSLALRVLGRWAPFGAR